MCLQHKLFSSMSQENIYRYILLESVKSSIMVSIYSCNPICSEGDVSIRVVCSGMWNLISIDILLEEKDDAIQ